MKKNLILILFLYVLNGISSNAQTFNFGFNDDFDYPSGTKLSDTWWIPYSDNDINPITVSSGNNLYYEGYWSNNYGKAIDLNSSGEDVYFPITPSPYIDIYCSFLVKVSSATSTGDFFFQLSENPINLSKFRGKVFIKDNGGGRVLFGLNFASTAANLVYSDSSYSYNTTHLVILKYSFFSGNNNDVVSLFIDPEVPIYEPDPDLSVSDNTKSDLDNFGSFVIRQGDNLTSPKLKFDSIIASAKWTSTGGLPVELVDFNVSSSESSTDIFWSTASEINNYGFEIERSIDKLNWDKIGFIPGKGNTTEKQTYYFSDKRVNANVFYRLKQIDNNGDFHYSSIKSLKIEPSSFNLFTNYPNPFNPGTIISYQLTANSFVTLKVFDLLGREITTLENTRKNPGKHDIHFDATELTAGIYIYQLRAGNQVETRKMLLVK